MMQPASKSLRLAGIFLRLAIIANPLASNAASVNEDWDSVQNPPRLSSLRDVKSVAGQLARLRGFPRLPLTPIRAE